MGGQYGLRTRRRLRFGPCPRIVLTVGDNFYPLGVAGVLDPQWQTTFRDVYAGDFWSGVVFRPTFGNHDHLGNTDAQISRFEPRWQRPDSAQAFMTTTIGSGEARPLVAAFSGDGWCFLRNWSDALAIDLYDATGMLRYLEVLRPAEDSE